MTVQALKDKAGYPRIEVAMPHLLKFPHTYLHHRDARHSLRPDFLIGMFLYYLNPYMDLPPVIATAFET